MQLAMCHTATKTRLARSPWIRSPSLTGVVYYNACSRAAIRFMGFEIERSFEATQRSRSLTAEHSIIATLLSNGPAAWTDNTLIIVFTGLPGHFRYVSHRRLYLAHGYEVSYL